MSDTREWACKDTAPILPMEEQSHDEDNIVDNIHSFFCAHVCLLLVLLCVPEVVLGEWNTAINKTEGPIPYGVQNLLRKQVTVALLILI